MNTFLWELAHLFIDIKYLPQNLLEFNSNDWKKPENDSTKLKFNSSQQFTHSLVNNLDSELCELESSGLLLKDEIAQSFRPYLCKYSGYFYIICPIKMTLLSYWTSLI